MVRAKRLRYASALSLVVTVLFALSMTTACASNGGCAHGAESATKVVQKLIDLSRSASSPADICAAISKGSTVTAREVAKLKGTFADEPDENLTITIGPQAGTDAEVGVTSEDGHIAEHFYAYSDDHSQWTVEFGQFG